MILLFKQREFFKPHKYYIIFPEDEYINIYLITESDNITDTCTIDTMSLC